VGFEPATQVFEPVIIFNASDCAASVTGVTSTEFLFKIFEGDFIKRNVVSVHDDIRDNGCIVPQCVTLASASVVKWSEFLTTDPEARVRFPALPKKKGSGSGTGSTQPRGYN
jgi:hypothetical protein